MTTTISIYLRQVSGEMEIQDLLLIQDGVHFGL